MRRREKWTDREREGEEEMEKGVRESERWRRKVIMSNEMFQNIRICHPFKITISKSVHY